LDASVFYTAFSRFNSRTRTLRPQNDGEILFTNVHALCTSSEESHHSGKKHQHTKKCISRNSKKCKMYINLLPPPPFIQAARLANFFLCATFGKMDHGEVARLEKKYFHDHFVGICYSPFSQIKQALTCHTERKKTERERGKECGYSGILFGR
jgi:hypothetical protein